MEQAMVTKQTESVESMIALAIEKNVDLDKLERILAMRKELKAEFAKTEFDAAMARFQEECPVIEKTKKVLNKDGKSVRYAYAPIDAIIEQVGHIIAKQGLSYAFDTIQDDKTVTAVCIVNHEAGHSKVTNFRIPIDTESYMSAPQRFAAALTFGKRYAFVNAFGIATGDEDTDAVDVDKPTVVASEQVVEAYRAKLVLTTSLDELKRVWSATPIEVKNELNALKDQMKAKLDAQGQKTAEEVAQAFGGAVVEEESSAAKQMREAKEKTIKESKTV